MEDKNKTADKPDNEMFEPAANVAVAKALEYLLDRPSMDAFLRGVSPLVKMGALAMPIGVAKLLHNREIKFLNQEWADTVKRIIIGGFEEVAEIITKKGGATNNEIKEAFQKSEAKEMESMVVVDPLRHVHLLSCYSVTVFRTPANKDPKNPPAKTQHWHEIRLKDAMSQGLKPSPCCLNQLQEAVGKAAPAPKPERKHRSPMEVFDSLKDEELKKQFPAMLATMSEADRKRTIEASGELNSEGELRAMLVLAGGNPARLIELLPLLEDRDASYKLRKYLRIVGDKLESFVGEAADHFTKWNASLAPDVERLRLKHRDAAGNTIPYEEPAFIQKKSFWKSTIGKFLTFDLF